MRLQDQKRYINFLRMSPDVFDELLRIVGPSITKSSIAKSSTTKSKYNKVKQSQVKPNSPIRAPVKLVLTLRLASRDSQMSLVHNYVIGKITTSHIITDAIQAIWN